MALYSLIPDNSNELRLPVPYSVLVLIPLAESSFVVLAFGKTSQGRSAEGSYVLGTRLSEYARALCIE